MEHSAEAAEGGRRWGRREESPFHPKNFAFAEPPQHIDVGNCYA